MQRARIPGLGFGRSSWQDAGPDPLSQPQFYRHIILRRFLSFLVDLSILGVLVSGAVVALLMAKIVTFGLLSLPFALGVGLVPLVYYTLLLGGPAAATPGMRIVGLELRSWDNGRPDHAQALLRTVLHYATLLTLTPLVLVVMVFNDRRRALHDILSGTVMVNSPDVGENGDPGQKGGQPPMRRG